MKIYTKFGDKGSTQLLGGQTTTKDDLRVAACGTLDEFSAAIGVVASLVEIEDLKNRMEGVQANLLTLGACIAALGSESKLELASIGESDVRLLEQHIDELQCVLPELRNFVLPGGSPAAAQMHFARTVCRRGERAMVAMLNQVAEADKAELEQALIYVNRLSDWCFVVARWLNKLDNSDEILWKT